VILGSEDDEVMEELRKCVFDIPQFIPSTNIIVVCDLRRVICLGPVHCMEETRNTYKT
jgi:hypothetical protein